MARSHARSHARTRPVPALLLILITTMIAVTDNAAASRTNTVARGGSK